MCYERQGTTKASLEHWRTVDADYCTGHRTGAASDPVYVPYALAQRACLLPNKFSKKICEAEALSFVLVATMARSGHSYLTVLSYAAIGTT